MQLIIESKIGGTTINGSKGASRRLIMRTGKLLNSINPVIKVVNGELQIDIEVVKYYQYLDVGTTRIKNPWFLTNELMKNQKLLESIERLTEAGIEFTIADNLKVSSRK
jgi:hypothetical protein